MRLRNTLLLLAVLLGLGGYVYWIEYHNAQLDAKKKTLLDFKADEVTELALTYPEREIALRKSDGAWRLVKPIDAEADESTVKGLLGTIADAEAKKTVEEAAGDLAAFGLDTPAVAIRISLTGRDLPVIKVGKAAPIGASAYAQLGDDKKVILTTSAFRSGVDRKVKDLRDKTILRFADDQVRKISVRAGQTDVLLAKKDDAWRIEAPAAYAADASVVRSYLSTLRSLRAVDFPDDNAQDLGSYGLDAPRLTVTLAVGSEEDQRQLLVGKENDKKEIFVKSGARPVVYTVSEWVYRDLNKALNDFRDKTVLAIEKDQAKAIHVRRADGGRIDLLRGTDKQWSLDKAEGQPAENAITQFANDVQDLKGFEIAGDDVKDLGSFGLDPASLTVVVDGENDTTLGTILLGQREKDGKKEYLAAAAGGKTVFALRDYLYTRLDKQPKDFIQQPTPTPGPITPGPVGAEFTDEDAEEEYGGEDDEGDFPEEEE